MKKEKSYSSRIKGLHKDESKKSYPSRYPTNNDSVGIEIVGSYSKEKKEYESISEIQNQSLKWLLSELYSNFAITKLDVFRHSDVSYKQPSEASSALW